MEIYLVGGAVRDELLQRHVSERDWVVVGATQKDMLDQGFTSVGKDFPVYLHPKTKEEYALARQERKTAQGYHGFEFNAEPSVTLEQDLLRRDLTINAIARREDGQLIDPYNGQRDLQNKILRHVSPAFAEDPVRLLRVARFLARYSHLGFTVADDTMDLMQTLVANGEVAHLVAERVWKELSRALMEQTPSAFFQCLRTCGALHALLPEIDALFGVPQPAQHHPEVDTGEHVLLCLESACAMGANLEVRFATLTHDLGKALTPKSILPSHHGHEQSGLVPLRALCERLKVPNECRELATLVCDHHTRCHRAFELKASSVAKLFKNTDAYRRPDRFEHFLQACKADACGRTGFDSRNYTQANYLAYALAATDAAKAKVLQAKGLSGQALGEALHRWKVRLIDELKKAIQITMSQQRADAE
jgi:tRNA nucleotidyltransferase (CCA-adding enzyme)